MRSIRTKEVLDRQDIDALLVGALYGELSSTDQERLNTHLEAHPADRNALDDLKSAQQVIRTKVASSRIFELQLDPPQAISAQLLQEAAHRAPKMKAAAIDAPAREGWFARFVQSFVRHPAMAAAATLVLVVGVAGSIYLRNGDKGMVEPTVGQLAAPSGTDQSILRKQEGTVGAAAGSGVDGVAVALAEDKQQETQMITGADRGAIGGASAAGKGAAVTPAVTTPMAPTASTPTPEPARHLAKPASKTAYVQSDHGELQPRDLDVAKVAKNDDYKKPVDRRSDPAADAPSATLSPRGGPGAALGQVSSTGAAPPPPVQVPAPAAKAPDSNFAWAKDQHARVAALVKAGNCQEAAPLGVAIKSRDPEYYNSFVATDRALKPCMQYMTEAADREAEKKPAKMRVNTDAK